MKKTGVVFALLLTALCAGIGVFAYKHSTSKEYQQEMEDYIGL